MSNEKSRVLVDLFWLLYRSSYAFNTLSWVDEGKLVLTGTYYGVLKNYLALREAFPESEIIYCTEPRKNFRSEFTYYKEGRNNPHTERILSELPEVLSLIKVLPNTKIFTADSGEADDVIHTLVTENPGIKVYIYSADNDLLPLVTKDCKIFRVFDKKEPIFITEKYLEEKYKMKIGFSKVTLVKSILGDSSDRIPSSVKRFSKKQLELILNNVETLDEILATGLPGVSILASNWARVKENYELVRLRKVKLEEVIPEVRTKEHFIRKYGLNTIKYAGV